MKSISLLRTVFIVAFLVAASIIPVQAQTADADSAAAALAVRAYHQALEAGDSQTILRLLASDALILENGDRETREEYREYHLQADILFSQAVPTHRSALPSMRYESASPSSDYEARAFDRIARRTPPSQNALMTARTANGTLVSDGATSHSGLHCGSNLSLYR